MRGDSENLGSGHLTQGVEGHQHLNHQDGQARKYPLNVGLAQRGASWAKTKLDKFPGAGSKQPRAASCSQSSLLTPAAAAGFAQVWLTAPSLATSRGLLWPSSLECLQ